MEYVQSEQWIDVFIDNFEKCFTLYSIVSIADLGHVFVIQHSLIIINFQSGMCFVSNVSNGNTQLFLFVKVCGVNSLANLPCSGIGYRMSIAVSKFTPVCIALRFVKI